MKWLMYLGALVLVFLIDNVWGDDNEGLVVAPSPEDDREGEEDELSKYDMYNNTHIKICANVANGVHLPYVGSCSKWIECEDGDIKGMGDCQSGNVELAFDPVFQVCTYVSKVQCQPKCTDYALSSYCYDNTCFKYVLCYYGRPVLRECHDGLQYNNATDRCDFPEYVDCVANNCSATAQPENIIYLPSKAKCDKYFICSNGRPWEQECSAGLYYSPECKCCDFAKNVNCTNNAVARNIQPYYRSPLRRADIECPLVGVHFYPHKSRSDSYYYCVDGHGLTLDCTPGLYFDPKVNECREPKFIGS
ncbi:protein obstructor-E [Drosophila subobscura]|uniref:protein obstructor-E n=1 Tax=Drosophila subobscura TaxID=7241 RepID=UPI00155B31AA|nr:protein obstructor-E [Drosophila subobscura]